MKERDDDSFDVIVIGGGVTGTGTARDCAMRGFKTLLIEKKDFAGGTTGVCSGMIHGGLRYLEYDIKTTKLSCIDSGYIQKMAPHLLFRIPFIIPIMKGAKFGMELMETVMEAYDRFSPYKMGKPHTRLSREEVLELEPGLSPDIVGAVTMDEWGIDVFRLCAINALSAAEHGAEIKNHCEVKRIIREGDVVAGVEVLDNISGERQTFRAKITINAAGPWVPHICRMAGVEVKLRPGKGTHLIFDRRLVNYAVTMETIDGREVFIIPHENSTLLGCTDDDYYGDLDNIAGNSEEFEYLLEAAERVIPSIRNYRIMRQMSGVRVTLHEWRKIEDKLSREHKCYDHLERDGVGGFLTIAGGKLATYRIMAQEITDMACGFLDSGGVCCSTHQEPLPGGEKEFNPIELTRDYPVSLPLARRLYYRQGARSSRILDLLHEHPEWARTICTCEQICEAEIRHVIRHEFAVTLDDVRRRTKMGGGPCQAMGCAFAAAVIMGDELEWGTERIYSEVNDFLQERWKGKAPVMQYSGHQLSQEEINQWKYGSLTNLISE
jgi:glycerol-3-phosphate dehydrogenase